MSKSTSFRLTVLTARQLAELAARWGSTQTDALTVCIDRTYQQEHELDTRRQTAGLTGVWDNSMLRVPQQESKMNRYQFRITSYNNPQQPPHDKPTRFMFAVEDTETGSIVHEEQEFMDYDAALNAARDYVATLRQS